MNQAIDWSFPQRQSPAALFIILLKVLRSMIRVFWPLFLLYFIRGRKGNPESWELVFAFLPVLLLGRAILEFLYYRFFIVNNELVIKKGIFRKQTISVPLEKIQAVHIEQTFLHHLLGTAKISFDSAGTETIEIKIDAIQMAKAESLKGFIMQSGGLQPGQLQTADEELIRLDFNDLIKLSISANHLEALFILFGFAFSLLESVKDLVRDQLTRLVDQASALFLQNSISIFFILLIISLVIAVVISTAKTFLMYFNFYISRSNRSFRIHSGLLNIKEKVVPFQKIQYVSWKATWLRKKIGLSLLHFHSVGGNEMRQRQQIKVPITRYGYINTLTTPYHSLLQASNGSTHLMHPSYAIRRIIWPALPFSLVPVMIALSWWNWHALWFLLLIPYTYLFALFTVKRFRLILSEEAMFIHRGVSGLEEILLKWNNIQKITLKQSLYQRQHDLATVRIHTAGGIISIPFITLELAQHICNYSLFKIENERQAWM